MKGIITICGSTRFKTQYNEVNLELTLADYAVFSVGAFTHASPSLKERITEEVKTRIDNLHFAKIDISQAIVVINKGSYIGESTMNEIVHALQQNKQIYWYEVAYNMRTNAHTVKTPKGVIYDALNWRNLLD
jgi:hypothetical protein